MARFHGHGPVLSKWPAAHLDRVVLAPIAARISRGHGSSDARAGTDRYFCYFSAAALAHPAVLPDHRVADRHHSHRQLRFPELSGFDPWLSAARRSILDSLFSAE